MGIWIELGCADWGHANCVLAEEMRIGGVIEGAGKGWNECERR